MIRVLSLGAGVQSTTLLLMSCLGQLPKLDAAVFADTQWEPRAVYEHLAWLSNYAAECGIRVLTGSVGNLREDALRSKMNGQVVDGGRWASIPMYTKDRKTGQVGMIKRQCTNNYKIEVIDRIVRRGLLGLAPGARAPRSSVEQWLGISADEPRRLRARSSYWQSVIYPLVFNADGSPAVPHYTRKDCQEWLKMYFPTINVPRSACIGCPLKSNFEWRLLRELSPGEWEDAVRFDEGIRHYGGMRGDCFLHRSCVPLAEADLSDNAERELLKAMRRAQGDVFAYGWNAECMGGCGL